MHLLILFAAFLNAAALAAPSTCRSIPLESLDKEVQNYAESSLNKYCSKQIEHASYVRLARACASIDRLDQGDRNYYYSLVYIFDYKTENPRFSTVNVGKYDVSNPEIPTFHLFGISGVCEQ